ncbi:SusD-like starch-binding protein associating with outer membrane [Flavobacteriaceae bacterium MAR_2010_72]|nr:SusD-like starch-binding protein associating with outer membrane [Flavobacteriaceae bacterium MAR_2010_72]
MKNLKFKYLCLLGLIVGAIWSCSEDFLEVEAKGQFLTDTYYSNQNEAFGGLVAVYDMLRTNSSGAFDNLILLMNSGSDDHVAGGGGESDVLQLQVFSNYTMSATNASSSIWTDSYKGIFRANILLSKLPDVPMDENLKAQYTAEAKALRAYYYFNLIRLYKSIPLITEPLSSDAINSVVQSSRENVYQQIENDLISAKAALPDFRDLSTEAGRFTKGAAQALLGKVYLYQGKGSQAAAELAVVNGPAGGTSQYGYRLLDDFNSLWMADNSFNSESIMEVTHSGLVNAAWDWAWPNGLEGNMVSQMVGPRSYVGIAADAPDLNSGWSFNPILPELYNLLKDDPRFDATILDLKTLKEEGKADYVPGYQDTGYFLKKFAALNADKHTGGGNFELNWGQNSYIIRLADTYLMEAEALGGTGSRAQDLLDAVRARVGLPSVPVSMDAIMKERRLELAGEGQRWFDLVRSGQAASKLSSRGFIAGKHEFFPIPFGELENTSLQQDPSYSN